MSSNYTIAFAGMPALLDEQEHVMENFTFERYPDSFKRYCNKHKATLKAVEDGYLQVIDKEQFLTNMAEELANSAEKRIAEEEKKNAKGKKVKITAMATDGSGKKATCKVVVTAPATATTAKKTTTTTAARSQTKRITTPTSGTTNRSVSTGSGTPTASGTTKTLSSGSTSGTGTGSTASKSATGTTAKKKDTAAEATTGSWNFSGEDYVPDTYAADETDAEEADTTAEKDNDTSKIVAGLGIFYIVKRICAIAGVVIIAFILYKKRHRIASALRNFQKGGDKE